jgi:hypothetical protein
MKKLTLTFFILVLISCTHRNSGNAEKSYKDSVVSKTDTLIANNYLLTIEKADSFKRTDIFGDLDTRLKLTAKIYNSHEAAKTIQKYLSKKFRDYFFTTDSTVVLKLSNGKTESFPFWDEKNEEGFSFVHFFNKINYILLHVQWDEGNCWMLVNRKNGLKKYINGLPYISLDNKKIITINTDLEANYSFNGIELYLITNDSLKLEFSRETQWGPIDLKWLGNNRISLKRELVYLDSITGVQKNSYDFCNVTLEKINSR